MSTLSKMIAESKRHEVTLVKKDGKTMVRLTLLVALIITFVAPQLLLAVLLGVLFDLLELHYDERVLFSIDAAK